MPCVSLCALPPIPERLSVSPPFLLHEEHKKGQIKHRGQTLGLLFSSAAVQGHISLFSSMYLCQKNTPLSHCTHFTFPFRSDNPSFWGNSRIFTQTDCAPKPTAARKQDFLPAQPSAAVPEGAAARRGAALPAPRRPKLPGFPSRRTATLGTPKHRVPARCGAALPPPAPRGGRYRAAVTKRAAPPLPLGTPPRRGRSPAA